MRRWVLWNPPHFRFSLALLLVLTVSLALSGCGGGGGGGGGGLGGGGGGGGGQAGTATLTGRVVGITRPDGTVEFPSATIEVVGTGLSAPTSTTDGKFNRPGVPLTAKKFRVVSNDANYGDYFMYQGVWYGPGIGPGGGPCDASLPTLQAGQVALADIRLWNKNETPPTPGPCPTP